MSGNELSQKEIDELLRTIDYHEHEELTNDDYCVYCNIPTAKMYVKSRSRVYMRVIGVDGKLKADGGFPSGTVMVCLKCGTRHQVATERIIHVAGR